MLNHDELLKKLDALRAARDIKDDLKIRLTHIQTEIDEINEQVTEYFIANGLQNMNYDGKLFFLFTSNNPNIEDPEACKAWLAARGDLEMLLSFNTNKFKAYFKEKLENNEELPVGVKQFVQTEVRVRKG